MRFYCTQEPAEIVMRLHVCLFTLLVHLGSERAIVEVCTPVTTRAHMHSHLREISAESLLRPALGHKCMLIMSNNIYTVSQKSPPFYFSNNSVKN